MSFEWGNIYRYEEEIDNRIAEEANEYVREYYDVDDTDKLTEDQINELREFVDTLGNENFLMTRGVQNIIDWWETDNL